MRCPAMLLALTVLSLPAPPALAQTRTKLADLAWLEGSWEGRGIDGAPATEVYSSAAGSQMVGHFRQLNPDGTAMFYELITLGEQNGVLTFSLKHFNTDLTGWEERDVVRKFPLSSVRPGRWEFGGLAYERTGPNRMTVEVATTTKDGKSETLTFHFRRKAR